MTEPSRDSHMPDVWFTVPLELKLNNGFSASAIEQREGLEQQQHERYYQTQGTNDTPHLRLPVLNSSPHSKSDIPTWSDYLEPYDPFYEWYGNDIKDALHKIEERVEVARDFQSSNLISMVQEATSPGKKQELLELLSLSGRIGNTRRPYLSARARNFLHLMGTWEGFDEYDGQLIHVDFTESEIEVVCHELSTFFLVDPDISALRNLPIPIQHQWLSTLSKDMVQRYSKGKLDEILRNIVVPGIRLRGREVADIIRFLDDCFNSVKPDGTFIRLSAERACELVAPKIATRQTTRLHLELGTGLKDRKRPAQSVSNLRSGTLGLLKPYKCFSGASSDVINVAWSPDGSKFGLGSTTLNDAYNRPGNLMLGCIDSLKIKLLDGHRTSRPEGQREVTLDDQIRCTVTGVDFSHDGELMYSSSYDHTVKIWEARNGTLLDSMNLESMVVAMAVSKPHNSIAASTKSGKVVTVRLNEDGSRVCHKFPTGKKELYASTLLWAGELNSNWLLAGYDTSNKTQLAGDCLILDASTGQKVQTIRPSTGGHYDMFLHHQSGFLATGVSAPPSKSSSTHSLVRLYSLGNQGSYAKKVLEFDSPQKDINVVTISPCQRYVTSSGTDRATYVWDLRFPGAPLTKLEHGVTLMPSVPGSDLEVEDTGVTFAKWGPYDRYFYTGSSDGVVKVWDVAGGNPFVRDLVTLDAQIMSAEFSPACDMLLVGVASGKATLLSTRADDDSQPGDFEVDLSDLAQPNSPILVSDGEEDFAHDEGDDVIMIE